MRLAAFLLLLAALAWRTGQPSDDPIALCPAHTAIAETHRMSSSGWPDSTLHTHVTPIVQPEGCE